MTNDEKSNPARLYVCNALKIFLRGYDPDLLEKSKSLDNIPEITNVSEWMDFVGAVHDENNSWLTSPNSLIARHYEKMEELRHPILIRMFRKYGLLKSQ